MTGPIAAWVLGATLLIPYGAPSPVEIETQGATDLAVRDVALTPLSRPEEQGAIGGQWSLSGDVRNASPSRSGLQLVGESRSSTAGSECLCGDVLFADGFETGDITQWSSTTP